jgi:hypothetical protein
VSDLSDLFWIAGVVTALGPRSRDRRGTTFQYVEICEQGGNVRRLAMVHVVDEVATLLEENAIGSFFFWSLPSECRLWCVSRADGPRGMDLNTMQRIIEGAE